MRPRETIVPVRAALPINRRAVPLVPAAIPPTGTRAYGAADVARVGAVPVSAAGVIGRTAAGGIIGAAAPAGVTAVVVSCGKVENLSVTGGEGVAGLVESCVCPELGWVFEGFTCCESEGGGS